MINSPRSAYGTVGAARTAGTWRSSCCGPGSAATARRTGGSSGRWRPPSGWRLTAPFGLIAVGDYRGLTGYTTGVAILSELLGYLLPAVPAAPLGARFGRRFPNGAAAVALGLILIGVTLAFLAPSYLLLIAGRVVSGLGAGALAALLALRAGHLQEKAAAAGIGAGVLALLLGFIAGPMLAVPFGWRLVFVAALPLTLLALLVSVLVGLTATLQTGNAPHHPPSPR